MLTQTFFKLFPPPKFLDIPHAGLDISDDALHCVEYTHGPGGLAVRRYGTRVLPRGVIESGQIKDPALLTKSIKELALELKISVVKASLPEERMYLFKTEVPSTDENEIRQNIEFKLEENVPLSHTEALFFFNIIPRDKGSLDNEGNTLASVSVAPQELVFSYLEALKGAGLTVLSFEIQPKALARALVPRGSTDTRMIVNIMGRKTGIYIVCGGVVCFTSTIMWGSTTIKESKDMVSTFNELKRELGRVCLYWTQHGLNTPITRIVLSGSLALTPGIASHCSPDLKIPVEVGNVWQNAFSSHSYIPSIPFADSLDYAVAAGLALPTVSE